MTLQATSNAQRLVLSLVGAVLLAASIAAVDQASRPTTGQAVFIVAARDSKLLTLCPAATEVKTAKGSYWESDRALMVSDGPYGLQLIRLMETRSSLLMPAPGGGPAAPEGMSATLGVTLDRDAISPDPAVKKWLEQEFAKHKEYRLAGSSEAADVVFVAESFWRPLILQTNRVDSLFLVTVGDLQANLLQGVLGFAVPAAVYRDHPGDVNAWLAARTWEGSVFYHSPRPDNREFASAAPQDLVKAFVRRSKPVSDHPPICAASNHPFSLEGVDAVGFAAQQAAAAGAAASDGAGRRADFRAEVTYVAVPVRANDANGNVVDGLEAADFVVTEDGIEQKVDRLFPMAEPFDVAVLIDTSASMRLQLEDVQNAVLKFIDTLRPVDRVMPVSFSDRVAAHSGFLGDRRQLRLAVFQVGTGEGTRLWDALHLLITKRLDTLGAGSRGAIVLFTDGVDTRSRFTDAAAATRELAESNVPVYVVQYDTRGQYRPAAPLERQGKGLRIEAAPPGAFDTLPYVAATTSLEALAETTGGRVFTAQSLASAGEAFDEVARELKGQYTIAYYPSNQARDGQERRITVTARRPDLALRYRGSYRAPRPNPARTPAGK